MNVWEQVLARVETKVNRHSFYTWFKPTSFLGENDQAISVKVPNVLFKDWLTKHYSPVLLEALQDVDRADTVISFLTDGQIASTENADRGELDVSASPDAELASSRAAGATGLNPRYTFDTFIVGPSNQFAHAASRAVAAAASPVFTASSWAT